MSTEEIITATIDAAYTVHATLKKGFLESVYKNALIIELNKRNIKVQSEKPLDVFYKGQRVGEFRADLVVEDKIILELKAIKELVLAHELQLVNYLKATGFENGLLINFGEDQVRIRRKFKNRPYD